MASDRRSKRDPLRRAALALLAAGCAVALSGCAFRLIPPQTLTVRKTPGGPSETLRYPLQVLVHDDGAFWDAHQIKSNLIGLTELEFVRMADLAADALIPGPEIRPLESSIDGVKEQSARLPDCALTRIVSQLLWAIGPEKACLARGQHSVLRLLYLADWVQFTFGELNRVGGYLVPGQESLIPRRWTYYPDLAVNETQNRLCGAIIFIIEKVDWTLDRILDGEEAAYGRAVCLFAAPFVKRSEPAIPGEVAGANGGKPFPSPAANGPSAAGSQSR